MNGNQVVGGSGLNFSSSGDIGIGTTTPQGKLDVEGSGNVIFDSGDVGIGADPTAENTSSIPAAPLYIAEPGIASIRLQTTGANHSLTNSQESIDFAGGPADEFEGEIAGSNADYPGSGLYQPQQMWLWSGESGGLLIFARDWPGAAGPIVFADGDYATGEVMRITTSHMVGIGGETAPASLLSTKGNASVGVSYSETAAPANGLIVQGYVGIGTSSPQAQLDVKGKARIEGGDVVVTGTGNAVLIYPAGDLSMGAFTAGTAPQ